MKVIVVAFFLICTVETFSCDSSQCKIPVPEECQEYCWGKLLAESTWTELNLVVGLSKETSVEVTETAEQIGYEASFSEIESLLSKKQTTELKSSLLNLNSSQLEYFQVPKHERLAVINSLNGLVVDSTGGLKDLELVFEEAFNINIAKGQKGSGCYILNGKPQKINDSEEITWLRWVSDMTILPTTPLGKNMQIRGLEVRLYSDGTIIINTGHFGNHSKHSNWNSHVLITLFTITGGTYLPVSGTVTFPLVRLRHGRVVSFSKSGKIEEAQNLFNELDPEQIRLSICLNTARYN